MKGVAEDHSWSYCFASEKKFFVIVCRIIGFENLSLSFSQLKSRITLCNFVTFSALVLQLNCTALSQSESINLFMYIFMSRYLIFALTIFGLKKRKFHYPDENTRGGLKGYVVRTLSTSRKLSRVPAPSDHYLFPFKQNAIDSHHHITPILDILHLFCEYYPSSLVFW